MAEVSEFLGDITFMDYYNTHLTVHVAGIDAIVSYPSMTDNHCFVQAHPKLQFYNWTEL